MPLPVDQYINELQNVGHIGQNPLLPMGFAHPSFNPSVSGPISGQTTATPTGGNTTGNLSWIDSRAANDLPMADFLQAIRKQESGSPMGNYHATNSAGATGAYQILQSNIPSWSRQVLGHSISTAQFLASKQLQDQIALAKLSAMVKAHGYQGAASEWYSGNPNAWRTGGGGNGGPSVADYVKSVMGLMNQY
jgi:hypothetical protein